MQSAAHSYLIFWVGKNHLAMDIRTVREVMDLPPITPVPRLPDFIIGVINLRGKVLPVIDMAHKLLGHPIRRSQDACIIIIESVLNEEHVMIGGLVDSVEAVLEIHDAAIVEAPRIGTGIRNDLIQAMLNHDGQFMMIADIDKILSEDQIFTTLPMKENKTDRKAYRDEGKNQSTRGG
jgi:purine-binding chemotaxis protein CheW